MALLPSMKQLHLFLLSVALLISYQQPIAVEHIKSATESSMSVTTQTVNSAITAIRDKESKMRNKWLTLEAWKRTKYCPL
jgi:hypothetical protein